MSPSGHLGQLRSLPEASWCIVVFPSFQIVIRLFRIVVYNISWTLKLSTFNIGPSSTASFRLGYRSRYARLDRTTHLPLETVCYPVGDLVHSFFPHSRYV